MHKSAHLPADELAADPFDEEDDEDEPMCTRVAGAMLPYERYDQMMLLPIVAKAEKDVCLFWRRQVPNVGIAVVADERRLRLGHVDARQRCAQQADAERHNRLWRRARRRSSCLPAQDGDRAT